jgi:flavin reductase (DIM6/NTAB) family NADH-FMN oxidoreductase RutF
MAAKDGDGNVGVGSVYWVTQTSLDPPLVAIGVKIDSGFYVIAKAAGSFALNMLGNGQLGVAFGFFKPAEVDGDTISGEPVTAGSTGSPLLLNAPAALECKIVEIVE